MDPIMTFFFDLEFFCCALRIFFKYFVPLKEMTDKHRMVAFFIFLRIG